MAREDLHVLTGSYALDALTESEREDFERHLHRCPSCEAEVRGLRETAARLAMAKAEAPPPAMAPRVMAATYRTRQLPPQAGLVAGRHHRRAGVSWLLGSPSRTSRTAPNRPWARMPRLVAGVAAAAVAVAVGLGVTQLSTQHQLDSVQSHDAAISRVVQAPDARLESMRTSAGGTVTVVFSGGQQAAVITTTGMKSLSSGYVYQLWVMNGSDARSEGLISSPGQTSQVLAADVRSGEKIGITVEPAGGTAKPTTNPVVALPLTA